MKKPTIYYVQYTSPACYPPLEHSARLLSARGWNVTFLGKAATGESSRLRFPPDLPVREIMWSHRGPGVGQKFHYAAFCLTVAWRVMRERPSWVYCSDMLSCPVAWIVKLLTSVPVVYHEHDAPGAGEARGAVGRLLMRLRSRVGRRADIVIVPNDARLERFLVETKRSGRSFCVFNVPSVSEVVVPAERPEEREIRLVYQGSINAQRLPLTILEGMRLSEVPCSLTIVGYEAGGSCGYVGGFLAEAARLGLGDRVQVCGAMPRREMMQRIARCDVGLAFMPMESADLNMAHMAGASNKPFDYLACDLAVLVSDLPEWRSMYVEPGYGLACDPRSPASIAAALRRLAADRGATQAMGARGRERLCTEWNYGVQFSPVMKELCRAEAGRG